MPVDREWQCRNTIVTSRAAVVGRVKGPVRALVGAMARRTYPSPHGAAIFPPGRQPFDGSWTRVPLRSTVRAETRRLSNGRREYHSVLNGLSAKPSSRQCASSPD